MDGLRFVDLFAGLGGFHHALAGLGHECVFASELNNDLRALYVRNFPAMRKRVFGDIAAVKYEVPEHDILCAGFPCQPFSKSGKQAGINDAARGTLFREILDILESRRPRFVILENVGNFARHDRGRTWRVVRESLERIGYRVRGTEHIGRSKRNWKGELEEDRDSADAEREEREEPTGLLSPHHFGFPQHRERFYVVASLGTLPEPAFPVGTRDADTSISQIVQRRSKLTAQDKAETALTDQQQACIEHWNELLRALPPTLALPSVPIWGDECGARYPFHDRTPWACPAAKLRKLVPPGRQGHSASKDDLLELLPNYARTQEAKFPGWKVRFIRQNRNWWAEVRDYLPAGWERRLRQFPPSLRKLEFNVRGAERDLWSHVLQFRPSGLRAKRYVSAPALVAMTESQVPILGPERRFLTRVEGLRLQGFPDSHQLPDRRDEAFTALGNAVHVGVVRIIAAHLLKTAQGGRSSDTVSSRRVA